MFPGNKFGNQFSWWCLDKLRLENIYRRVYFFFFFRLFEGGCVFTGTPSFWKTMYICTRSGAINVPFCVRNGASMVCLCACIVLHFLIYRILFLKNELGLYLRVDFRTMCLNLERGFRSGIFLGVSVSLAARNLLFFILGKRFEADWWFWYIKALLGWIQMRTFQKIKNIYKCMCRSCTY